MTNTHDLTVAELNELAAPMAVVELDIYYEENLHREVNDLASKHNVGYRVVQWHGPAGGWPVVRFVGSIGDIEGLVADYENSAE